MAFLAGPRDATNVSAILAVYCFQHTIYVDVAPRDTRPSASYRDIWGPTAKRQGNVLFASALQKLKRTLSVEGER